MSIELINHEASETQFLGSKQFYGSCEDRFGNNFGKLKDDYNIIVGESKIHERFFNHFFVTTLT